MNDIIKENEKVMKLNLFNDNLEAHLMISPAKEKYNLEEILEFLKSKGVVYGILNDAIIDMIENNRYNEYVTVAKGLEKVDGEDGYYEFCFDNSPNNAKPKVLIDGSIDYRTLRIVQVKEGDVLVRYTPAVDGERGYDVKGKALIPYRGKDQKPIKGKGFTVSEDKRIYTAAITGKIEYSDNKIVISNVIEIRGDVDHLTGDIYFDGDVIVYGNVTFGTSIKSMGNVTVQGHMEGAEIIAGKDVVLQNGAQGAGRGKIEAKGSVSGKFFEQMIIKAGNDVNANSILNCDVECEGEIVVSGKLGILVGGRVKALKQVSATIIGNLAEIKTDIEVGLPDRMFSNVTLLDNEIQKKNLLIEKIESATKLMNENSSIKPEDLQQKKLEVMRSKIRLNMEISELTQKRSDLISKLDYVPYSKVIAHKRLYPGVRITVNGETTVLNDVVEDVTVKRKGQDVCLFSNH